MTPEILVAVNAVKDQTMAWMREHNVSAKIALKESDVLKWVIMSGADAGGLYAQDLDEIVHRVMQEYCGVRDPKDRLTVGQLRTVMRDLPDGMPVFYEHIEDTYFDECGWRTLQLETGDSITDPQRGVAAFSASVATDPDGKTVLALTAHY